MRRIKRGMRAMCNATNSGQSQQVETPANAWNKLVGDALQGPPLEAIGKHYGYENLANWHSAWLNRPDQLERLSRLPEVIRLLGVDKRIRITFDFDPSYSNMLLQATVTDSGL